jgi:REP element-mobilizing transposase RayT
MSVSLTQVSRRNLPHWRRDGAIYWVTFRLADSLPQAKLAELRNERTAWLQENPEPWTPAQFHDQENRFGQRVQRWLDAGYGSCALARPDIRETVRRCLTRFDGDRLHLHAAVIMPNHVHALIEPARDTDIPVCVSKPNPQAGMPVSHPRDTDILVCASKPNPQAGRPVSHPRDTDILVCASDQSPQAGRPVPPSSSQLSRLLKGIKGASARAANQLLGQSGAFWMDESYDRIVRGEEEYRHFRDYIQANPQNAELAADQYWLHLPP